MQSDIFFFTAIIAFFFVMWLAGGGPSKPISWQGPYITPITNTGQDQYGYGSTEGWIRGITAVGTLPGVKQQEVRATLGSAENKLADLQIQANKEKLIGTRSPYYGQVRISLGNVSSTDPDREYIIIQALSSATEPITITGWRVQSVATDYGATIGLGSSLPETTTVRDSEKIVLNPGERAYLITGTSPVGGSFRESKCTGYLEETATFYPSLNNRCPTASDEFDRYFAGNQYKDQACYTLIRNTRSCTTPKEESGISRNCLSLIDSRLTYPGCVASHKYDAYFNSGTWRIYLGRTEITRTHTKKSIYGELWKTSREGIKLLDANGLTVDLYTY